MGEIFRLWFSRTSCIAAKVIRFGIILLYKLIKAIWDRDKVGKMSFSALYCALKIFYSRLSVASFRNVFVSFHLIIHEPLSNYLMLPIGGSPETYKNKQLFHYSGKNPNNTSLH